VEVYRIDSIKRAKEFQKHRPTTLEATLRTENRRIAAGTRLARTAQPLGSLTAYLLEPQSDDGLATWNFFDAGLGLEEGRDFVVLRLPAPVPLKTGRVRPLPDDRQRN